MNRRELLREMSRVQATWVNRNTPGTGDVNIAVEDEQEYLTKIAAVFERAREDVRRKRGRAITAASAIEMLLAGFDRDQPRDRKGRWSEREGGAPSTPSAPATVPVAKPRPKPEPAKAMIPEATLAAAPKALDAEKGRSPSKSQTAALERYRGSDFAEINAALRGSGKRTASIDKTVAEMDAAHAESKLTEDVVVYRGIGNVERVFGAASKKNLTGAEWLDEAPQSTTATPTWPTASSAARARGGAPMHASSCACLPARAPSSCPTNVTRLRCYWSAGYACGSSPIPGRGGGARRDRALSRWRWYRHDDRTAAHHARRASETAGPAG